MFRHHDNKLLVSLLFPAVGLVFLIAAIRATARALYFGNSTLHLSTLPVPLGGSLVGTIHVNRQLAVTGPISLRLTCRQINRNGDNSSESVAWEDEQVLDRLPEQPQGTDIPVYFSVPADQRPTSNQNRTEITWRLDATAPTARITYRSRFAVPVFAVTDAQPAPSVDIAAPFRHHDIGQQPEPIRGVTISLLADKGRVIHMAAARNPGAAATVTLFGLIFTLIAVFLPRSGAPIIFPIVFGLAALIIDIAAINSWLSSSTITARPRSLTVDRGLPMMRHHRELPADSITSIGEEISSTANSIVYYAIIAQADGKRIRLASGIRGKQNAEHLVTEVLTGLGREQAAAATERIAGR